MSNMNNKENKNLIIIKYDGTDEAIKIRYLFLKSSNIDINIIFNSYKIKCKLNGIETIPRNNLSEYDYFLLISRNDIVQNNSLFGTYYILNNGVPMTEIKIKQENKRTAEIRLETVEKYQRKGYATIGLQMAEQLIFASEDIDTIHLNDVSEGKITTLIAIKNGYNTSNGYDFYKNKKR